MFDSLHQHTFKSFDERWDRREMSMHSRAAVLLLAWLSSLCGFPLRPRAAAALLAEWHTSDQRLGQIWQHRFGLWSGKKLPRTSKQDPNCHVITYLEDFFTETALPSHQRTWTWLKQNSLNVHIHLNFDCFYFNFWFLLNNYTNSYITYYKQNICNKVDSFPPSPCDSFDLTSKLMSRLNLRDIARKLLCLQFFVAMKKMLLSCLTSCFRCVWRRAGELRY